jgi:hypothetical protein
LSTFRFLRTLRAGSIKVPAKISLLCFILTNTHRYELLKGTLGPTRRARKDIRYPLEATVVFSWEAGNGSHQRNEGRTYDISDNGAFILSSACPPAQAQVNLEISIPAVSGASKVLMEVKGRVLRVEQARGGEGRSGFAVLSSQAILYQNH